MITCLDASESSGISVAGQFRLRVFPVRGIARLTGSLATGYYGSMHRSALVAQLAHVIESRPDRPLRVGIDGVDASGKTTLADELAGTIGRTAIRSSIDFFSRPRAHRYRRGRLSSEGYYHDSHDFEVLITTLLAPLAPGESGRVRLAAFDLAADAPVTDKPIDVEDGAILIFDGVFLQRVELVRHFDMVIFVHCPFDEVLTRARIRDRDHFETPEALEDAYRRRYVAGQQIYLRECSPLLNADIVVDNTDAADPVVISDRSQRKALHDAACSFVP